MKSLFSLVLLFVSCGIYAQSISGLYTPIVKSNDPQGGSVFFVTEDNHWGALAFGTALYGTVKKENDSLYRFAQLKPKIPFSVYSRYNDKLGDSMRIFFSDFSSDACSIHFDKTAESEVEASRIFNRNANCFSFPNVAMFPKVEEHIAISYLDRNRNDVYEFYNFLNKKGHNDFIIINNIETYYSKDLLLVNRDSLLIEPGRVNRGYKKRSGVVKEVKEMHTYLDQNITYSNTVFYSNKYKEIKDADLKKSSWLFSEGSNCYSKLDIAVAKKKEEASDYNEPTIIYPFKLIESVGVNMRKVQFKEKTIFYSSCDD